MLCEERLGVKSWTHVVEPGFEVPCDALPSLEEDIRRMASGEPVQYVLGYSDFFGRRFRVNPSVLIPRPETEQLVQEAVEWAKTVAGVPRVLDLCTGSGCIAWSVRKEIPSSQVVAVDISEDALAVARSQFDGDSPEFVCADVLDVMQAGGFGSFDLILSNPPYVKDSERNLMRTNVLDWEPEIALFVPDEDALRFYDAVAGWAERCLRPGGRGIVEINETLGDETAGIFMSHGFSDVRIIPDFFGKSRFVSFFRSAL